MLKARITNGEISVLEEKAAGLIAEKINLAVNDRGSAVFAVPGGRSVKGIFNNLGKADVPWENVNIFMIDERLVSLDSEESNFRLVREFFIGELIQKGILLSKNVHPFVYLENDEKGCIDEYSEQLKRYGGRFDVFLLSSGEDGHVGALYPNHHSIKNDSENYISMGDSPKPPTRRMSASRRLIERSDVGFLLFFGEGKRNAYDNFCNKDLSVYDCPAKVIDSARESYVFVGPYKTERVEEAEH